MSEKEYYDEMWSLHAAPVWGCVTYMLGLAAAIIVIVFLTSCKTVYVPVESVHNDTLIVNKWQHDSIWIETLKHDSVTIKEKGDTVFVNRWHTEWRDRWRDREVHDTTYISRTDSIQVPYPVEKKVPFWEKAKLVSLGGVGAAFIAAVILLAWWIHRRYKRY